MGKFFNSVVMNRIGRLPANLEALRKQFNEEHKNDPVKETPPKVVQEEPRKPFGYSEKLANLAKARQQRAKLRAERVAKEANK